MGSTVPAYLCRLCLQTGDDVVNIWEQFEDSTIATILGKHFWFQVNKNDGLTEWLCRICWVQTKTFHEFYNKVEQFQKCYWDSIKDVGGDNDQTVVAAEPDLIVVKCEETESTSDEIDLRISEDEDFEYSDNGSAEPQNSSDKRHRSDAQSSNDKSQPSKNNSRKVESSRSDKLTSQATKEEQTRDLNVQLREWFTMKCDICSDSEFETWLDVRRHYRKVHQMAGYLTCCGRSFRYRSVLLAHIRHHIIKPDHSKVDAQIYEWCTMKCDICPDDVPFKTLLDVRRHYREVHKIRGYLTCCNRKFYRRHMIIAHIRSHTNPDEHRCEQCGKSFKKKIALKNHIDNHVPLDSRAFKCHLCSSSFAAAAVLKAHILYTHTSKNGENFQCETCNKNYRSELLLKCHIRQCHTSINYVCEVCARQFKSKQILRNHFNREHSTTPLSKVQCNVCGVWLKNEYCLPRHKLQQHGNNKPVNCPMCDKVCRNKRILTAHVRATHAVRKHDCVMCDKAFPTARKLMEHVATHTGQDLYECPYCDKKFKSNANLCSHRKKAHLEEWTRDKKKNT